MDAIKLLKNLDLNEQGRSVSDIAARHVRRLISRGILTVGTRIPSGRELAEAWGISYVNAQRALAECASQGFLHRRRNAGTVVAEQAGTRRLTRRVHVVIQETEEEARATDFSRSPYFAPLLAGMQEEFSVFEIMAVTSTIFGEKQEKLFLESLHDHPVDAVLLFRSKNTPIIQELNRRFIPLLLVDPHVLDKKQPLVLQDSRRAARDAVSWLINRRIQSPTFAAVDDGKWTSREWIAAFREALLPYYSAQDIDRGGIHPRGTPPEHVIRHLTDVLRSDNKPDAMVLYMIDPDLVRKACTAAGMDPEGLPMVGYSRRRGVYRPGADIWNDNSEYGRQVARIVHKLVYARNEPLPSGARYYIPLQLADD